MHSAYRRRTLLAGLAAVLTVVALAMPLVAQSGGEPLQVMGEYDGRRLLPLAVLPDAQGRRYSTVMSG